MKVNQMMMDCIYQKIGNTVCGMAMIILWNFFLAKTRKKLVMMSIVIVMIGNIKHFNA